MVHVEPASDWQLTLILLLITPGIPLEEIISNKLIYKAESAKTPKAQLTPTQVIVTHLYGNTHTHTHTLILLLNFSFVRP